MVMCLVFILSFFSFFTNPESARTEKYVTEKTSFDTSKVLSLIKNGIDGLNKDYPEKKITIEFFPANMPELIYANVLMDGQLIFVYNIDIKGYSIVGYKDLRKENMDVISWD